MQLDLQIYPLSYCTIDNINRLNYTNKIILNKNILENFSKHNLLDDGPFNVKVTNRKDYGEFIRVFGIEEFSAPDNIGYMSLRLMDELMIDIGDRVSIEYYKPPKGSFVLLKPLSSLFYSIQNIKHCLEQCIQHNYPILEKDTSILFKYEDIEISLLIKDCKPYDIISTYNTDLEVEFEPCDECTPINEPINEPFNEPINEPITKNNNVSIQKSNAVTSHSSFNKKIKRKPLCKPSLVKCSPFKAFTGKGYKLNE